MHTVDLMEEALRVAKRLGYTVRHEWLGGTEGGAAVFAGKKWLFVDLSLTTTEQLDQVGQAIKRDPSLDTVQLSPPLRRFLRIRQAA